MKIYRKVIKTVCLIPNEIPIYALYIGLYNLSHEGCIHNYNSSKVRKRICEQLQISDSQFRKLVGDLKAKGLVWINDTKNGKELRIRSQNKLKEVYSTDGRNFKAFIRITDITFPALKVKLRYLSVLNKALAMQHMMKKQRAVTRKNYMVLTETHGASKHFSMLLSRNTIKRCLGKKSKASGYYWAKKFKKQGLTREQKTIVRCADYPELFEHTGFDDIQDLNHRGFFFIGDELYKRTCNMIRFKTEKAKYKYCPRSGRLIKKDKINRIAMVGRTPLALLVPFDESMLKKLNERKKMLEDIEYDKTKEQRKEAKQLVLQKQMEGVTQQYSIYHKANITINESSKFKQPYK